ncbi:DoxX family protein [Microbacterium allomyrinae]|uniref:DoxX family protein n=1 Tax=Microbacterium allomyrinae TaxID=2830666 RepID=A0A9X1LU93_9MICO|nr:DoxX family protein [Microbacterium allomyrinae]MCC2032109.1 DoxX family protein [Microbacterium allomyrinae]
MTTIPVTHGAAGLAVPTRTQPIRALLALEARAEAGTKVFLERWSIPALRVALGAVFVVFGALKFVPGASPVESLVMQTWDKLTFGLVGGQAAMIATALIEVAAGALLILGGAFARIGLVVLALAFIGILSPIVLLPAEVFGTAGPTLTGQYIFKNAVLIAAALVIASRVLRGPGRVR